MSRNRAEKQAEIAAQEDLRKAKMEAAWPHLRSVVRRRVLQGEPLEDLAGVVTDSAGSRPDEDNLTVGVLTREELRVVLADNAGTPEWLTLLRGPAPDGCIFVFGALEGLPAIYTLGPVFTPELAN
jgi:hypothetical protein